MLFLEWVIITQGEEGCKGENEDGGGNVDGSLSIKFAQKGWMVKC